MVKKLDFIIYLRCLALFMVVIGHALCIYSPFWRNHIIPINNLFWENTVRIIYLIHMPLFSIIAGYIYFYIRQNGGYDSPKVFFLKKIKRIFVPLMIFGFFECTFDLNGNYGTLLLGPLHLWYLSFLLKCFIVTYLYDKLLIKRPVIVLPLVAMFILGYQLFASYLSDQHFFQLYPYFLMGIGLQSFSGKVMQKNTPPVHVKI